MAKPDWLVYTVDLAVILGAISTTLAVIVAVVLARRSETPRILSYFHYDQTIVIGTTSEESTSTRFISLTVVNAGILPVKLVGAVFVATHTTQGSALGFGGHTDAVHNRPTLPRILNHGEHMKFQIPLLSDGVYWKTRRAFWWLWRRPEFRVTTSLGKTHVIKPPIALLRIIKKEWKKGNWA